MEFKIDLKKDYGLIGLLIIMLAYTNSLIFNYISIIIGIITRNNNLVAKGEFIIKALFSPAPIIFFIITLASIYFILKKQKYFAITTGILFLNMILIKTSLINTGMGFKWFADSGILIRSSLNFETIIIILTLIYMIAYGFLKIKKYKNNHHFEIISAIIMGIYFLTYII